MEFYFDEEDESVMEHRIEKAKKAERIKRKMRWEKERRCKVKRNSLLAGIALALLVLIAVKSMDASKEAANEMQSYKKLEIVDVQAGKAAQTISDRIEDMTASYCFQKTQDTIAIHSEEVISSNAILVNESNDTIVASKRAKKRISPASMTKVLTILVAAEHIKEENLDDTMTITLEITDYAYANDCSTAGFAVGEVVTVRDLFYGTILPSGGDAALGLATYVSGSHEVFVEEMNKKLAMLGLAESSHFTNCVGLYNKDHYSTVYDMAVIMKAALKNELCREILTTRTYTTTATDEHPEGITISNWFIRRIEDKDDNTGGEVLGAKTGYVVQSKNCAVSYGIFYDTPYICVTAGATGSWRCIYDHVEIYTRYVPKTE